MKQALRKFFRRNKVNQPKGTGLSTFEGVFTPSILTILGVIMYLRFGWVVGNVGLLGTLIIVTLSTSITFLTALSISAIATDQRVRVGGAYYMISRSLGLESGGSIGIPLYLAQALSVALYVVGFAESLVDTFPALNERWVGLIVVLLVAMVALLSARTAIRSQFFIMAAIAISLLSLLFGEPIEDSQIELWGAKPKNSEDFWVVFAVFFPAVTGIMAGVNMSGDLKNPGKSIPKGTFLAIGAGYLIYMGLPILLASRADALTLIDDPLIMKRMAVWGDAILLGVWGATLSSAVGSMLGAPRVLQALARDGVLPRWMKALGKGHGPEDTPRVGTILTMGVAMIAVFVGDLNLIAPVLSMFFLTTYGVLNITAGTERFLGSPSFRPRFKVHWSFSLLGALGCIAVMFLINAVATVVAFIFIALVFFWLQRRELETAWGDVRNGIWMAITRAGLMRIDSNKKERSWRPHPLVLSGAPTKRWHLIDLASSLTHNRGILSVAMVMTEECSAKRQNRYERNIRNFLVKRGIQSLARVITAENPYEGAEQLVNAYGLGALVPNTIILGNNENAETREAYCDMITRFHARERNMLIVHNENEEHFGKRRTIDVWWGGLKGNGGLMMVLAYLLQTNHRWYDATVTVKMMVKDSKAAQGAKENLKRLIGNMRTGAKAQVIVGDGRSFDEILHASSSLADLVFLGLADPQQAGDNYADYFARMQERIKGLPTTVLVLAAENTQFDDILIRED